MGVGVDDEVWEEFDEEEEEGIVEVTRDEEE